MSYIGIDLHSDRFTVNFKDDNHRDTIDSYYLDSDGIKRFRRELNKDDHVFLEASTPTFAFTDVIKDDVKETVVIDPLQFKAIVNSGKKTDKVDAGTLARMGRYHVKSGEDFLPEVYIPKEPIRKLRSLFTSYKLINKQIVMLRNRIHSLFKQNLKPYSKRYIFSELRYNLESSGLDEEYIIQVRILFELFDKLEEKKEELNKEIKIAGEPFIEDIDILISIRGVSIITALGLISDYASIERFDNAKQFSKYLRSTPKTEESNKRVKTGKTQRSGRRLSLELMLQGISHFNYENLYLYRFYHKIKRNKGACKARIALVRKMFVIIFYMLRNREYYRFMNKRLHDKKMREYRRFLEKNK